jgi:hypothetical protein
MKLSRLEYWICLPIPIATFAKISNILLKEVTKSKVLFSVFNFISEVSDISFLKISLSSFSSDNFACFIII